MTPARNLRWETSPDGQVTLFVPKFTSALARKWLVPLLAKPDIRVQLDARGSYVWSRCDGNTTVAEIGSSMAEAFHEPLDALYDRIGKFIQTLARDKFLVFDATKTPA